MGLSNMLTTHVLYSEFHENTPPWRTAVVVCRNSVEIGRVAVSEDILTDANRRFGGKSWGCITDVNAELSAWITRWFK